MSFIITIEPITCTCNCRTVSEWLVKHNTLYVGIVIIPFSLTGVVKRSDTPSTACCLLVIVIERQYGIVVTEYGVWLIAGQIIWEIAWIRCAFVYVGISVIYVSWIVFYTCTTNKFITIGEHFCSSIFWRNTFCAPSLSHIDCSQGRTTLKHRSHVCYVGGVESAQIQACYVTIVKHSRHVCHVGGVESAQIQACYVTIVKHVTHVCNVIGLQIFQACDGCLCKECPGLVKPITCTGNCRTVSEWLIKYNILYVVIVIIPTSLSGLIKRPNTHTTACCLLVIVIER